MVLHGKGLQGRTGYVITTIIPGLMSRISRIGLHELKGKVEVMLNQNSNQFKNWELTITKKI